MALGKTRPTTGVLTLHKQISKRQVSRYPLPVLPSWQFQATARRKRQAIDLRGGY